MRGRTATLTFGVKVRPRKAFIKFFIVPQIINSLIILAFSHDSWHYQFEVMCPPDESQVTNESTLSTDDANYRVAFKIDFPFSFAKITTRSCSNHRLITHTEVTLGKLSNC